MRLFATDLDGTFIHNGGRPSEKTKQAVKLLKDNGFEIIGISGRVASSIRDIMDELKLKTYIIGNNGAILLDKDDNILFQQPLNKNVLREVIDLCDKHKVIYHMYDKDNLYSNKLDFTKIDHFKIAENEYCVNFVINKNIKNIVLKDDVSILKLAIYVDYKDYPELYRDLKSINNLNVFISGDECIDCMSKDISKGFTLEKLAEILNIKRENIVAIGDQENDMTMIKYAGTGIAMGNAIDELKNEANFITANIEDEGFYTAVQKILDI